MIKGQERLVIVSNFAKICRLRALIDPPLQGSYYNFEVDKDGRA